MRRPAFCLLPLLVAPIVPVQAEMVSLVCDYDQYSDVQGLHPVKDKFVLSLIVDSEKEQAHIIASEGSRKVHMISSALGVTFIELLANGNVSTTLIDKQLISVHSQSTLGGAGILASQYYGNCEVREGNGG